MRLTVLLFASYADAAGRDRVTVDVEPGETVGALVGRVQAAVGAGRLPPRPVVAVNHRYRRYEHVLAPGDEVAVIPPVAGG